MDHEALEILSAVAHHLEDLGDGELDEQQARELADYVLGLQTWRDWRDRIGGKLQLSGGAKGEVELEIARRVAAEGEFAVLDLLRRIQEGQIAYPRWDELQQTMGQRKVLEHLQQQFYQLTQRWSRCRPPLLSKQKTYVYEPLPDLVALFEQEPAKPVALAWLWKRQRGG